MARRKTGHADVIVALLIIFTVRAECSSAPPVRIAVVGGGLAGLGTAAHLASAAETPIEQLHVFDAALPGEGGASAVAAGLLHPFTPRGREIWNGASGFDATCALLARVEALAGPCSTRSGLLRLALSEEKSSELQSATAHDDSPALEQSWISREEASALAAASVGGLGATHAPAAVSIDVTKYVRGLWSLIQSDLSGADVEWRLGAIDSLEPLLDAGYDAIIVAMGARIPDLAGCANVPLTPCRGQNLVLSNTARLAKPLIAGKYVVPIDGGERLLAGATFEYDERGKCHRPAEPAEAMSALLEPLTAIHPALATEEVVGCQAGVRALPPRSHFGYVPIAGRLGAPSAGTIDDGNEAAERAGGGSKRKPEGAAEESKPEGAAEVWLVSGLGSRGLIHHALIGRSVAHALLRRDADMIDEHVRRLQKTLDECQCAGGGGLAGPLESLDSED